MTDPRGRESGGFSLLELLVAVSLMGLVAGALYASLHVAFKVRGSAEAATAPARTAAAALGLLAADVECALPPRGILAGAFLGQRGVQASGRPSDALSFHAPAGAADTAPGPGDIRRVDWLLERPADGGPSLLLRRTTSNLLAREEPPALEEVVCRGVESLELRYHDGYGWRDSWDSTAEGDELPVAVEATLELARTEPYRMTRRVLLSSAPAPDAAAGGVVR